MHQAKSGRCRFTDQDLGRIALFGLKRYCGGGGTCKGVPHEKEQKEMSHFEKFVTEGNEKADELAKEGALLDEGFMTEEVYVALQYAAGFHCFVEQWKDCEELKPKPKEKLIFVDQKREETKHRTQWCAEADRYRCVRCGRGSKYMKMPGKGTGPKFLSYLIWKNGEGVNWEVMTWSEEWTDREKP